MINIESNYKQSTFTCEYKGQSQMDVNTINGIDISGRGAKIVGDIHRAVKEHKPIKDTNL